MAATGGVPETGSMTATVVIVDDDLGFRSTLTVLLETRDLQVVASADDFHDGIERVLQQCPDLVFIDVNLPDADGLSVARELRRRQCTSTIVLMSTLECPWSKQELTEVGVLRFVEKERLFEDELVGVDWLKDER